MVRRNKQAESNTSTKAPIDSQALTKEQEEEMSSALIAKLLAQDELGEDHPYYSEYGSNTYEQFFESDHMDTDDDYDPTARGKTKKQGT